MQKKLVVKVTHSIPGPVNEIMVIEQLFFEVSSGNLQIISDPFNEIIACTIFISVNAF